MQREQQIRTELLLRMKYWRREWTQEMTQEKDRSKHFEEIL